MVAQVDIIQEDDADFYQTFAYTMSDGVTPISVNGWTFKFGVRRFAAETGLVFVVTSTLSSAGQITLFDAPNGKFTLWISQPQLLAAPKGMFVHSLIGYSPAQTGVPSLANLVWTGMLTLNPGPSR